MGYFLSPLPIAAVLLMILNDRYLKNEFPGALTGKISDFAGIFFVPLFLVAIAGFAANFVFRFRPPFWISRAKLLWAIVLTDAVFVAVKVWPVANAVHVGLLAAVGFPSVVVMDPTDLWALVMNFATFLYAKDYWQDSKGPSKR